MLKGKNVYLQSAQKEDLPKLYKIMLEDNMGNAFTTTYYECTLNNLGSMLFETDQGTQSKVFVAKKDKEIIGFITLNDIHPIRRSAEIGALGLKGEYQKKTKGAFINASYAYEISGLLAVYAFEVLNLNKLTAHTFSNNDNVDGIYKVGGFIKEGIAREYIPRNGKWLDRNEWGLIRKDYDKSQNFKDFKKYIDWK